MQSVYTDIVSDKDERKMKNKKKIWDMRKRTPEKKSF